MSWDSRAAVLNSFRYKAEDPIGEFVYGFFAAYVLFTRTIADIENAAIPLFLVMVVCYQIAALIVQLVRRKIPNRWDVIHYIGTTIIFSATYLLVIYGVIAVAVDAWSWLKTFWANLDPLENRTQFMIATGLMTVALGGLFFGFRLKQRFLYGLIEACAGVAVGMHRVTLEHWPNAPQSPGFYLALLTAGIYLVVRGLDNMHQAVRGGDPIFQRLVNFSQGNPPLRKEVRRLRIPRIRHTHVRKVKSI